MKLLLNLSIFLVIFNCQSFLVECAEKINNKPNEEPLLDKTLSDNLQKALDELPADKIPNEFKQALSREGDDSHWCCKVTPGVTSYEQTRTVSYAFLNSENQRCGSNSCGFLGWSSCTRWCTVYWQEIRYYSEHYTVYQNQPCPASQIICCTNFFFISGHCFHLSEVQGNVELLAALNNQGIVIPPGK